MQSEVNDALVALNLDHLLAVAVTGADVVDNSALAKLVSASATADWDDFVNTTDALQALRDNLATAAALATVDTVVDAIKVVTDALPDSGALTSLAQGSALTTVDTVVDAIKVITDALGATAAANLALSMSNAGLPSGAAVAGTLSITQMTTDLAEATDDHYIGRTVIWTSGNLAGQGSDITDYLGSTGMLTYTTVTEPPVATDTFIII